MNQKRTVTTKTKLTAILLAVLFCACLTSCGDDIDVTTEIKYTVYENEGRDMVSFYLTSEYDEEGEWKLEAIEHSCLAMSFDSYVTEQNASFATLVFEPTKEGEELLTFRLENGGECQYLVKCAKDENGVMRITVTVKKYALVSS